MIPANTQLTPWPDGQAEYGGAKLAKWDTLSAEEKKLFIRQADVFAAYAAYTDYEIGRVIQDVEDDGQARQHADHLHLRRQRDERGRLAGRNAVRHGGARSHHHAGRRPDEVSTTSGARTRRSRTWRSPWAWAFDTPFKWTKQIASHFGGTRQGLAISWPGHITDVGGIRTQFHHFIDIAPTILEAAGIPAPVMVNGIAQKPIEGVSMAYTFDKANANAPSRRTTQYFEMMGNRAIYHDGWIATTTPPAGPWLMGMGKMPDVVNGYKWELYNIAEDYSEYNDLAAKMPDKLRDMQELFLVEASKYQVLPLDNDVLLRALSSASERDRRQDRLHLLRGSVRHA